MSERAAVAIDIERRWDEIIWRRLRIAIGAARDAGASELLFDEESLMRIKAACPRGEIIEKVQGGYLIDSFRIRVADRAAEGE